MKLINASELREWINQQIIELDERGSYEAAFALRGLLIHLDEMQEAGCRE